MPSQRRNARQLLIMGHRGAKEVAPENTLRAFQLALDTGVDAIELDVHLSKDGKLIVMHDPRLDRTTDGSGAIRDFTLAELKALNAAASFADGQAEDVQHIPTLQEVYDLVQGRVQINIEIKTDDDGSRYPDIEAKVIRLIERNGATAYTVLSSFDFATLATIQSLAPAIRIYAIVARDYFQRTNPKHPEQVVADLVAKRFSWVAINKGYLNKPLIDQLHAQGLTVHAWVINDVSEMWSFVAMGVDAITTDRPDLLVPAYRTQHRGHQAEG